MKVLLYTESLKAISKSGLGKAIKHQMKALDSAKISYTNDPNEQPYDVAHINFYLLKSYRLVKKLRKQDVPVVYHAHSTEEDFRNSFIGSNLVSPLFKKWLCKCYRLGDIIITPTEYSKKLLESYHLNRKIYAISNGIELEFFKRDEKGGKEFRKYYHYKPEDKVIVGIGLYLERKGILDFVELAKRLPEYQFIWFGYTPLYTVPSKIRKAVRTKLPNLKFAGYVEPAMIKKALSGCNLYLFPTLEETEGIPIIEACAMKTPALIRDIPVFDGWLQDGVNVYKAKTIDEFEDKIVRIINHDLKDLTEEAYQVAKERDIKNIGKQLKQVYEEAIQMKKDRAHTK